MALFRNPKFDELEKEYSQGKEFNIDGHLFTLTLNRIIPYPVRVLDYDWTVTLSDGFKFDTKMGPDILSHISTRLEQIINELKSANRYTNDFLANAINDEIDKVFRSLPLN